MRGLAENGGRRYTSTMIKVLFFLVLLPCSASAAAQSVAPGRWDVRSTVVDISVPGVPAFLVRVMRGKSKVEHKRIFSGQGIEALIAPDPKAKCRVERQNLNDGHYLQTLACPQKQGEPIQITRSGTYDGNGFVGRASASATTPKGAMSIVLDQRAVRVGD